MSRKKNARPLHAGYDKSSQLPDMVFIATGQNQRDVGFWDVRRPRKAQSFRRLFMLIERAMTCSPDRLSATPAEAATADGISSTARRNVQQDAFGRASILTRV